MFVRIQTPVSPIGEKAGAVCPPVKRQGLGSGRTGAEDPLQSSAARRQSSQPLVLTSTVLSGKVQTPPM